MKRAIWGSNLARNPVSCAAGDCSAEGDFLAGFTGRVLGNLREVVKFDGIVYAGESTTDRARVGSKPAPLKAKGAAPGSSEFHVAGFGRVYQDVKSFVLDLGQAQVNNCFHQRPHRVGTEDESITDRQDGDRQHRAMSMRSGAPGREEGNMPRLPFQGNGLALSAQGLATAAGNLKLHAAEIWTVVGVETSGKSVDLGG